MIDILQDKIKSLTTNEEKFNCLREYLQLIILREIDKLGYFRNIAFVGGTALRILYDLKRFSEDLDFCLIQPLEYEFSTLMEKLEKQLNLLGINVGIHYKTRKSVACAFIKFNQLLRKLKLSNHEDRKLMVKFEIDQKPPQGYHNEFSIVNSEFFIGINHYDLASLFSGKLHAILCRKYTKGRDYYDFLWYCAKSIKPNLVLLENSLQQTGHHNGALTYTQLKELLMEKCESTNFTEIASDVSPFLEDQTELRLFQKEYFLTSIEKI